MPDSDEREEDAAKWISRLNTFASGQVDAWNDDDDDDDNASHRRIWSVQGGYTGYGGEDLLMYGMRKAPDGGVNPGVVYNDWIDSSNTGPKDLDQKVCEFLGRAGIRRVVTGHRPHGDAGLTIRSPQTNNHCSQLTVITMDTSYAASVKGVSVVPGGPRRGIAVSELLLTRRNDHSDDVTYDAVIHGIAADGNSYEARPGSPESLAGLSMGDPNEGWYVKGRRSEDGQILLSRMRPGERWPVVENRYIPSSKS